MSDIRDYPSRLDDPKSRKFETFSYLPALDARRIRRQVEHIVARDWQPAVEHVEPAHAGDSYWYMWKLPMFDVRDVDAILAELDACRKANPGHHVRIIGYDSRRQTQGLSLVVYRA